MLEAAIYIHKCGAGPSLALITKVFSCGVVLGKHHTLALAVLNSDCGQLSRPMSSAE